VFQNWSITTDPAIEPVTTAEAKTHMRITSVADDTYIGLLITAARQWCEYYQNRAYIEQSITMYMDDFPSVIYLPMAPAISVTSVKYYNSAGTLTTLTAVTDYMVDVVSQPGRIYEAYDASWPACRSIRNAVQVIYKAGYGAEAADVPATVKHAIKILVATWYESRDAISDLKFNEVPFTVKALLDPDCMNNITFA
jgi:uncharacterized phiE125 gp8 family phage protein